MRFLTGLLVLVVACDDSPEMDECADLEEEAVQCEPLYMPTFEEIYTRTLIPSCALGGGACHAQEGGRGSLTMAGIDTTYEALVRDGRVVPGMAMCSILVDRLEASSGIMPPGKPLNEAELCTVRKWIHAGALR